MKEREGCGEILQTLTRLLPVDVASEEGAGPKNNKRALAPAGVVKNNKAEKQQRRLLANEAENDNSVVNLNNYLSFYVNMQLLL